MTSSPVRFLAPRPRTCCKHVWRLLPLRRRQFRRSLSFFVLIVIVAFVLKLHELVSTLAVVPGTSEELSPGWLARGYDVPDTTENEEQVQARRRFAALGVKLIKLPEQPKVYKFQISRDNNLTTFMLKKNVNITTSGDAFTIVQSTSDPPPPPFLTVLVISRPCNVLLRQAIRKTWGLSAADLAVSVLFVVGYDESWSSVIHRETKLHQDLIALDEEDTYESLPNKVLSGISHVLHQRPTPQYVMKVDDDTVVNLAYLVQELHSGIINSSQILGAIYINSLVIRDPHDKWAVSVLDYPYPTYPTYAFGGGYVLPLPAAVKIMQTRAKTFDWIHLEDVYITGILARRAQLSHVHHEGFAYWTSVKASACEFVLMRRVTSVNHTEMEVYLLYQHTQDLIKGRDFSNCSLVTVRR
ncbi:beta-1,3-galactosyltransferase 5-like [Physella acuta]|uniref:beta-1,3-galactosyltransferase 5-like n=1 Tax=Physella acuta TaxID=109671 RepID=UPI0027DE85C1|nr:beta-1,3-galactosyltransferase 5-like [Physella acuta]